MIVSIKSILSDKNKITRIERGIPLTENQTNTTDDLIDQLTSVKPDVEKDIAIMKDLNAGAMHKTVAFNKDGENCYYSTEYKIGELPDHKILSRLINWLEEEEYTEVLQKIEEIADSEDND